MKGEIIVSGNGTLVRDPELKSTNSGKYIAKGSIAWNTGYKDNETAHFIDFVAWEKLAEIICKYCTKGSRIGFAGYLHQSRWEHEGIKKSKHDITIFNMSFIGDGKPKNNEQSGKSEEGTEAISDEDIPF